MKTTTIVASAVSALKKTANPSSATIPSNREVPGDVGWRAVRSKAAPTPARERSAGAADRRFFPATCTRTSRRIVAVTAISGRKWTRLARFPRGILDHRLHDVDELEERGVHEVQDRNRVDAEEERDQRQRREAEDLAGVDLLELGVF